MDQNNFQTSGNGPAAPTTSQLTPGASRYGPVATRAPMALRSRETSARTDQWRRRYRNAGECSGLQAGGEGRAGRAAKARPELIGPVVVPSEVRELLAHPPRRDTLQRVDEFARATVGGKLTSRWTWLFSPLNATSSISKPAHTARMISSIRARCRVAEHPVPKLRHKTKGVYRAKHSAYQCRCFRDRP